MANKMARGNYAIRSTYADSLTVEYIQTHISNKFEISSTGCWEWTAAKLKNGYSVVYIPEVYKKFNTSSVLAHRVLYELIHGRIRVGLVVDHICRNRRCVNPNHLQAVTPRQNIMAGKGLAAYNNKKNHCINGHEFNNINTKIRHREGRITPERCCRVCLKIRSRKYYEENKIG